MKLRDLAALFGFVVSLSPASADCTYLERVQEGGPASGSILQRVQEGGPASGSIVKSKSKSKEKQIVYLTLAEFRAKKGLPQDMAAPSSYGCNQWGGSGGFTEFQVSTLERVVVEGSSKYSPSVWQDLTGAYFINSGSNGETSGSIGAPAQPASAPASGPVSPIPKEAQCAYDKESALESAKAGYENAIKSCEELKVGIGSVDFLINPVRANCRDGALTNWDKTKKEADGKYRACMSKPG